MRLPSPSSDFSIAFNIVGYVEKTIRAFLSSLLSQRLHNDADGKCSLKASFA